MTVVPSEGLSLACHAVAPWRRLVTCWARSRQIPGREQARFVNRRPFLFAPPASSSNAAHHPCRPLSLPPMRHRAGRGTVPDRSLALPQILSALLSLVRAPGAARLVVRALERARPAKPDACRECPQPPLSYAMPRPPPPSCRARKSPTPMPFLSEDRDGS